MMYSNIVKEILLRGKGLYRVTMAIEVDPNASIEKIKWHNSHNIHNNVIYKVISEDAMFNILEH